MSQLAGKLALITGAASGIGLSSARLFARHGADLALIDRSQDVEKLAHELQQENAASKIRVTSHILDVTSKKQVTSLFEQVKVSHATHLHPNVLLNSAGIARVTPFVNVSEKEYDEVINVNLKGLINNYIL